MTVTEITFKTNAGKNILLNRGYKEIPDYTVPSDLKVGINQTTPNVASTGLDVPIPILDGTVCDDGSNTFTGSSGGSNSTDNTSIFKEGASTTDVTAQNLIANDTSATKKWDIAALDTNAVSTKYISQWHYIKDAATLAKYLTSGTCLEIRIGADTTTNYYSQVWTASQLAVGWNWIGNNDLLSTWTVNGTPGTLSHLAIIITTNNATDEFVAGDVVYDLLRQWEATDLLWPIDELTINESAINVEMSFKLGAGIASGFLANGASVQNTDATPKVSNISKYPDNSKADTDIFIYTFVDRMV